MKDVRWHTWGNRFFLAAALAFGLTYVFATGLRASEDLPGWATALSFAMMPVGAGLAAHLMGFVMKLVDR